MTQNQTRKGKCPNANSAATEGIRPKTNVTMRMFLIKMCSLLSFRARRFHPACIKVEMRMIKIAKLFTFYGYQKNGIYDKKS